MGGQQLSLEEGMVDEKKFWDFSREIVELLVSEDLRLPREGPPRDGIRRRAVSVLEGSRRRFVVLGQESFSAAQREVLHLGPSDQVIQLLEVAGSHLHIAQISWVEGVVAFLDGCWAKLERLFDDASMVWTVETLRTKGYTLFVHSALKQDRSHGGYHLCVVYRGGV